ncbi:MAG: ABC transporter ATP-binding protein [Alphaproteobacteria bacterium]|nr:ABC transporter ATP-binding protein [Alphaproteobacteria bacterium]MDP6815494.1 ABC transporter ATP-binding protein [Alphaproteobacteria bacterium]
MINIADLTFQWRPKGPGILDIERLSIADGERVFLHGPSGSGKTSLLNLLGGIVLPQRGRVELLGQDITPLSSAGRDRFRADHIGLIFQVFNLLPYLSLIENVALPCLFSTRRRRRAIRADGTVAAGAWRLLEEMDIPPARFAGQPVRDLSTGQQQRVAAARALIGDPEIIIADEPTSALDGVNTELFLDLIIQELQQRPTTLVFVSHDERLAERFDRTVSMSSLQPQQGATS